MAVLRAQRRGEGRAGDLPRPALMSAFWAAAVPCSGPGVLAPPSSYAQGVLCAGLARATEEQLRLLEVQRPLPS